MQQLKRIVAAVKRHTTNGFSLFNGPEPAFKITSEDPKEIAQQLGEAFEAFKAANDEQLENLKKDFNDGVVNERVETINATVTDLQAALEKQQKAVSRLSVSGDHSDKEKIELESAARFFTIKNEKIVPPDATVIDMDSYRNYKKAWWELAKKGGNINGLAPDLRNEISVGFDPDGGYGAPTEFTTEVEKRVFETSNVRQDARVISGLRNSWKGPFKANDAVSGGWVGEKQARPSTDTAESGMQEIRAQEQYAYPEITQTAMDDILGNAQEDLIEETADKISRTENTAYVNGNGVVKPRGFMDYSADALTTDDSTREWGILQYGVSGAAAGFPTVSGTDADDPDAFIDLMAKLNPVYRSNAQWFMNRASEAAIRKFKDTTGRYLVGFGDIRDGVIGFNVFGAPIRNYEDMADIGADTFPIAYGDMRKAYLIIDRVGLSLLIDPYTNKPFVGFYFTKRTGGDVRNFDALKLMKISA